MSDFSQKIDYLTPAYNGGMHRQVRTGATAQPILRQALDDGSRGLRLSSG